MYTRVVFIFIFFSNHVQPSINHVVLPQFIQAKMIQIHWKGMGAAIINIEGFRGSGGASSTFKNNICPTPLNRSLTSA